MKNVFLFCLSFLLLFVLSCKVEEQFKRPSVLYVSGIVTDKNTSLPINIVFITLSHSAGLFSPSYSDTTFYSKSDGTFSYQFSPKDNLSYTLEFDKSRVDYLSVTKGIDRDKERQEFKVELQKYK